MQWKYGAMVAIFARIRKLWRSAEVLSHRAPETVESQPNALLGDLLSLTQETRRAWRSKSWLAARDLCGQLRDRFPEVQLGYQLGTISARTLMLFDEAHEILGKASISIPTEAWMDREKVLLAVAQGDLQEAASQAELLRRTAADDRTGYQVGVEANRKLARFSEAAAILAMAERKFPEQAWVVVQQMRLADARSDHISTIHFGNILIGLSSGDQEAYRTTVRALRQVGNLNEAEKLLTSAITCIPPQPWTSLEGAEIMQARQEFSNADAHLVDGIERFHGDRNIALAYAVRPGRDSTERRIHSGGAEARRRLQHLCETAPDFGDARAALAEEFLKDNCPDDAEALFADREEFIRESERCALAWARIPELKRDLKTAEARILKVLGWFPDRVSVQARLVVFLTRTDQSAWARQVVDEALKRFPHSLSLLEARALVAEKLNEHEFALRLWEEIVEKFPQVIRLKTSLMLAEQRASSSIGGACSSS